MTNTQTDTRPAGDQALSDATGVATASLTLQYVTLRNLLSGALVAAGRVEARYAKARATGEAAYSYGALYEDRILAAIREAE